MKMEHDAKYIARQCELSKRGEPVKAVKPTDFDDVFHSSVFHRISLMVLNVLLCCVEGPTWSRVLYHFAAN